MAEVLSARQVEPCRPLARINVIHNIDDLRYIDARRCDAHICRDEHYHTCGQAEVEDTISISCACEVDALANIFVS